VPGVGAVAGVGSVDGAGAAAGAGLSAGVGVAGVGIAVLGLGWTVYPPEITPQHVVGAGVQQAAEAPV
jgi:hypothetical protein